MNEQFIINTDGQQSIGELKLVFHRPKKYVLSKTIPIAQKDLSTKFMDQRLKKKSVTPEYFTNILKEQKKNMFVNTFIKKLKSTVVLSNPPTHKYLSQNNSCTQEDQLQLHLPKFIQLIMLIIWSLHAFSLLILTSLALIFQEIDQSNSYKSFMIVSFLLHLFQISSKFFVHLDYQQNKLTKIRQITNKYFKGNFWLDMTILFGLVMYLVLRQNSEASFFFRLLILFKFYSLLYIVQHLQITLIQNVYRQQIWSLIKVFIFNFAFAHILTLALILMARIQTEDNWLVSRNLNQSQWSQKYIWAYYWATTIMLTVGFGDITPRNSKQALCMIFIQTMSCIVLAYNVNNVGTIIQKIRSYQAEKSSNLKTFNHINQKSEFSNETKNRIMNYIKQSAEIRRNFNLRQQKQFIQCLPQSFKSDMLKQMNRHIWNGMMFFQNLSEQTLIKLSITIQKKLAHPEEIVYTRGNNIDILVFNGGGFGYSYNNGNSINNGEIMQYFNVPQNKYQIASLDFLFGKKLRYDIKCTDYSVIYRLSTEQLIKILNNHSYDSEYFFMIKDKDKFLLNEFQVADCEICTKQKQKQKKQRHSVFKCPRLHYLPLKQHVVRKRKEKYFPIIFSCQTLHSRLRKTHTLLNHKVQKKNIQSTRQFVNNYLNNRSQRRIESGSFASFNSAVDFKDENLKSMEFIDGELKRQATRSLIQNTMNTKIYEKAIEDIRSKLDNMIYPAKFSWDLETDLAFNFKFYFRKHNPDEIGNFTVKKSKNRIPGYKKIARSHGYRIKSQL